MSSIKYLLIKNFSCILSAFIITSNTSISWVSANSSDYEYELDLTCSSTHYFDDEEDTTTYFYAETDYEGESVTLVNADDLTEYTMLDDGKFSVSGDDLPYDGIYSAKIELDTNGITYESPKILSFYAITEDGVRSKIISIKIVRRITDIQISEMNSVNEAINALVESENYTLASFENKSSMICELLVNLSESGIEEYPYSLIFPDSINFTGKTYVFKYSCGVLGGVSITDPFETVEGDVNNDGTFTIADVVLLQKWILTKPDATLKNWKAGDLCEDGKLNVLDLCMMKRKLVENMQSNPEVIDEFTPCTATLEDDFMDWKVHVIIKHQYSVSNHIWTISDFFNVDNIKNVKQYELNTPYRQIIEISLNEKSKENVLKLIHDIEALNIVEIKEIQPVFYYTGDV